MKLFNQYLLSGNVFKAGLDRQMKDPFGVVGHRVVGHLEVRLRPTTEGRAPRMDSAVRELR